MELIKAFRNKETVKIRLLIVGSSLLIVLAGVMVLVHRKSPSPVTSQDSNSAPVSDKPSANEIQSYVVAADLPRYIYIPAIHVDQTRIIHLGVGQDGQIASPSNIYDTGWYRDSVKPGKLGAMFIYGHISSWTANGIFHDLKNLKPGDQVIIERGDGKKFTYEVTRTKTYPADKVNMAEALAPDKPGTAGLNLMTCAGKVKKGTNDFTERLVVFTELQP